MRLWQALRYLVGEASTGLRRGWKVAALAAFTIGMSLFLSGLFVLVGANLEAAVSNWAAAARVVVYFDTGLPPERGGGLDAALDRPWVAGVDEVSAAQARERFARSFPSLADVLGGGGADALPASIELRIDRGSISDEVLEAWIDELEAAPGVDLVDDDRDWLREVESVLTVVRAASIALGVLLVVAAVFTTASVIRLTAYLYREEIEVMRLVGSTELLIRGPFYCEGLLQGLAGGLAALGALWTAQTWLAREAAIVGELLAARFLPWYQSVGLLALGGAAGLIGAVVSLRREVDRTGG